MRTGLYTFRIATSGTILHRVHWCDMCATHCASQKLSVSAWQKLLMSRWVGQHNKNFLQVHSKKLICTHTTSHHLAWCPCTDHAKFSCLCKSLDGAGPFVSATMIQLTPSYTSYSTHTYSASISASIAVPWRRCVRIILQFYPLDAMLAR